MSNGPSGRAIRQAADDVSVDAVARKARLRELEHLGARVERGELRRRMELEHAPGRLAGSRAEIEDPRAARGPRRLRDLVLELVVVRDRLAHEGEIALRREVELHRLADDSPRLPTAYTDDVAVVDSTWSPSSWRDLEALQQPEWPDPAHARGDAPLAPRAAAARLRGRGAAGADGARRGRGGPRVPAPGRRLRRVVPRLHARHRHRRRVLRRRDPRAAEDPPADGGGRSRTAPRCRC